MRAARQRAAGGRGGFEPGTRESQLRTGYAGGVAECLVRKPKRIQFLNMENRPMKAVTVFSLGMVVLALAAGADAQAADLKAGDKAPAFKLKGSDGKTYELAQFKDKKVVVVAWFPKAFTGG